MTTPTSWSDDESGETRIVDPLSQAIDMPYGIAVLKYGGILAAHKSRMTVRQFWEICRVRTRFNEPQLFDWRKVKKVIHVPSGIEVLGVGYYDGLYRLNMALAPTAPDLSENDMLEFYYKQKPPWKEHLIILRNAVQWNQTGREK